MSLPCRSSRSGWEWPDYKRIDAVFNKGKFLSRLLQGDVGYLEGFVQICTDLAEQIYIRSRENHKPLYDVIVATLESSKRNAWVDLNSISK